MLNVVVLMGRLVADPQLRQTTTGKNAVIAGGTGIATHQTPIHRTVPRASRTFCVRPP